jgi:hypothetical protein
MKREFSKFAILRAVSLSFAVFLLIICPVKPQVVWIQSPSIEQQQTPVWCWAASIQNALATYGVVTTQEAIVTATYGTVVNASIFDPRQAVINLLNNNYLVAPEGLVIHPFFVAGPPRPEVLIRELGRERSPLLVFYMNPQGGGHVVVCYGAKYTGSESYPMITEVWIKDPWDVQEKIWPGAQLASLWKGTVFLRVAPLPKSPFVYNGVIYAVTPTYEIVNQYNRMIEGRVWYFNEFHEWHILDNFGQDRGPIPWY